MSIRNDDKRWLISEAAWAMLEITDEQIEQFCDRVEAAVKRDDEPRWVAREFEFKAITNNDN
jgi:DNA polymerase III delta subunit